MKKERYVTSTWSENEEVDPSAYASELRKPLSKFEKEFGKNVEDEIKQAMLECFVYYADTKDVDAMIDLLTAVYDARSKTARPINNK